jgi:hypothetical protein
LAKKTVAGHLSIGGNATPFELDSMKDLQSFSVLLSGCPLLILANKKHIGFAHCLLIERSLGPIYELLKKFAEYNQVERHSEISIACVQYQVNTVRDDLKGKGFNNFNLFPIPVGIHHTEVSIYTDSNQISVYNVHHERFKREYSWPYNVNRFCLAPHLERGQKNWLLQYDIAQPFGSMLLSMLSNYCEEEVTAGGGAAFFSSPASRVGGSYEKQKYQILMREFLNYVTSNPSIINASPLKIYNHLCIFLFRGNGSSRPDNYLLNSSTILDERLLSVLSFVFLHCQETRNNYMDFFTEEAMKLRAEIMLEYNLGGEFNAEKYTTLSPEVREIILKNVDAVQALIEISTISFIDICNMPEEKLEPYLQHVERARQLIGQLPAVNLKELLLLSPGTLALLLKHVGSVQHLIEQEIISFSVIRDMPEEKLGAYLRNVEYARQLIDQLPAVNLKELLPYLQNMSDILLSWFTATIQAEGAKHPEIFSIETEGLKDLIAHSAAVRLLVFQCKVVTLYELISLPTEVRKEVFEHPHSVISLMQNTNKTTLAQITNLRPEERRVVLASPASRQSKDILGRLAPASGASLKP